MTFRIRWLHDLHAGFQHITSRPVSWTHGKRLGEARKHLEAQPVGCARKRWATPSGNWNRERCRATLGGLCSRDFTKPRSGELRTQVLKSHLVRTQSLTVLPLKPGVGQYIAIPATLTARDFFFAYFYPSSPFTCIFSKTSPNFFLCWPAE